MTKYFHIHNLFIFLYFRLRDELERYEAQIRDATQSLRLISIVNIYPTFYCLQSSRENGGSKPGSVLVCPRGGSLPDTADLTDSEPVNWRVSLQTSSSTSD